MKDVHVSHSVRISIDQKRLWMGVRRGLLVVVNTIEETFGISPRTSELRDMYKKGRLGGADDLRGKS